MDVSLAVLVFLAASFGGGFVLISVWNTLEETEDSESQVVERFKKVKCSSLAI